MLVAGTSVPASAKNADLVDEIAFLHFIRLAAKIPDARGINKMKDPGEGRDLLNEMKNFY
jgi:hypothetical protein